MISWHEISFVRIAIPLIIGIVLANSFPNGQECPLWLIGALSISFLCCLILLSKRTGLFFIGFFSFMLALGATRSLIQSEGHIACLSSDFFDKKLTVTGKVSSIKKGKKTEKIVLKEVRIAIPDSLGFCESNAKILVYLRPKDSFRVQHGDLIGVLGYLNPIESNSNPSSFDYRKYLARQGIAYSLFSDSLDYSISTQESGNLFRRIEQLRMHYIATLRKYLPKAEHIGIVTAMVLGYKEELDADIYEAYSDTGAVHVLAVSGLHVGIIAFFVLWALQFVRSKSTFWIVCKCLILLFAIWFYAFLTGAAPAVLRAALMFSIITVAKEIDGRTNIYNSIATSALIMLFYDPYFLYQLGFQFSYLAVISIVFFQPYISKYWTPKYWLTSRLWTLISVAIAAQIMVFPISIYYFHKFPIYFFLSGVLAIPMAMLVILLGILLLLSDNLSPTMAEWIAFVLRAILDFFNGGIHLIQQLPFSKIDKLWMDPILMLLLYLLVFSTMRLLYKKAKLWLYSLSLSVCLCIAYLCKINYQMLHQKEVVFYDIDKNFTADFIFGKQYISLGKETLEEEERKYNIDEYRIQKGLRGSSNLQEKGVWNKEAEIIQFCDQLFYVPVQDLYPRVAARADWTIITSNELKIPDSTVLHGNYILANDLRAWREKKWFDKLEESGLRCHSIRRKGAFVIQL